MNKLIAGIAGFSLAIASPAIASAKQSVTRTIAEDRVYSQVDNTENITKSSLGDRLISQSVARLDFSWRTAPLDLALIGLDFLMNAGRNEYAGALLLLASGNDVYVVRVRLHNSGNVPLRIYPQNIKVSYGSGSTSVIPIPDNRFLQPDILQPNYYIDKPVIFIAPLGLNLLTDVQMGYGG